MKRIILDHFKRRWLIWALFCLLFMAAGLVLAVERDIRISGILYISISIIAMDLGSGCPRALLSLPFTARQIGRAYWWLSVGASTLLFAIFSAVGILILRLAETYGKFLGTWLQMFVATGPQDKFLGIWLEMVLAGGLLCGSFFWLMSSAQWGIVLSRAGGRRQEFFRWRFYVCAFALALLGGICLLYKSTISLTDKAAIACLFGFVFSVSGWFGAERLFLDKSSIRWRVIGTGRSRGKFTPRPGYGGVPYLIVRFCIFYLSIVALLIAISLGAVGIAAWHDHRHWSWSDAISSTLVEIQICSFYLCLIQALMIAPHLKFLRSLPLTSKQLAVTILGLAILPILTMGGLWSSFLLIKPAVLPGMPAVSILKFCLLDLAPVCVLTTGVIWYNEKHFKRISGIVLPFIFSIFPLICQLSTNSRGKGLPMEIIIALPVLSLPIALFTISRLLERNEMTYRIKFDLARGW